MARSDSNNLFGVEVLARFTAPAVEVSVNGRAYLAAATLADGATADSYDVSVEADFTLTIPYLAAGESTPTLRDSRDGGRTWATRT
jgi:hypothetical protein